MRFLSRTLNTALTLAPGTAVANPTRDFRAEQWAYIDRYQLGVLGWDPVGHEIGLSKCGRYTPFDRFKQTLIGDVLGYDFYEASYFGFNSDESDWNIYVLPDPRYRFILDEVKAVMSDPGENLQKENAREVVECEITPDENFYVNPYFERPLGIVPTAKSTLTGRKIGLYGPWIRDFGHDGRPELHPCELIWWLDRTGPRRLRRWTMLVVQDDSNRFDRKGDYSGSIAHPWSEVPRRAVFSIAARARSGIRNRYRLSVRRHRNMAVMSGPISTIEERDYHISAGFGRSRFPGTPAAAATIERRIDRPRDIDPDQPADLIGGSVKGRFIPPFPDVHSPGMLEVGINQIDRNAVDGAFRFFINIQVQVGATDRGREGYAELVLEELDPVPVIGKDVARIADRLLPVSG